MATSQNKVYVSLLDEGTEVYREVFVEPIRPGVYKIIGPQKPIDEEWEFEVGDTVEIKTIKTFSGNTINVVISVT